MAPPRALPNELTIYTVGETCPSWRAWLAPDPDEGGSGGTLQVDASPLSEVDGAGLQLLVALANGLRRQGRRLQLTDPTPALAQACAGLGADFLLETAEAGGSA